jgi:hypothetical protein
VQRLKVHRRLFVISFATALLALSSRAQNLSLSNAWSISGGQAAFVTTSNTERGIAYNPQTKHVLVVSRASGLPTSPAIMVLDSATGAVVTNLSTTGILTSGTGITFSANLIGVGDDGVIYVCNLTGAATATSTNNFIIYRWANENASPTVAFQGQVGALGSRWGDNFDVRGSGSSTQMIVGQSDSGTGTKGKSVAIFTTVDGITYGVTVLDSVNGALSDFNRGLSFGPGNTIYSKSAGATSLKYSVFDLNSTLLSNVTTYAGFDSSATPLKVDAQRNLLAMLRYSSTTSTNQYVSLYSLSGDASTAPLLQDTKYCPTNLPNSSGLGSLCFGEQSIFVLSTGNSLMALTINTSAVAGPPVIVQQPASQYVYQGALSVRFSVSITGAVPFSYQWQKDGANMLGRTNASLVLTNVTADDQGLYQVVVTNSAGSTTSYAVPLMVRSPLEGNVLSNIWDLTPLSRPYLSDSDSAQRGLAYNPEQNDLLLATRTPTNSLVVLDAATGAHKHLMNVDSEVIVPGVTYPLNTIGVADDGVVYGAPLVVAGSANSFRLYTWRNDAPTTAPEVAFTGDPGNGSNLRWGDSFAVRGADTNTQILMGPGTGSSVAFFTTQGGQTFDTTVIAVTDSSGTPAPSGFAQLSVTWGTGNTFWTKSAGQLLRQVQFDLATGKGTIVNVYDSSQFPATMTAIGFDPNRRLLAALMFENPDNVQLFDMADPFGPTMIDQGLFTVKNSNTFSTGVAVFGGNHLFVLDSNNGIKAFTVFSGDAGVAPFSITGASVNGGLMTLTWPSVPNHSYRVQYKDSLDASGWIDASAPIMATNVATSFSEPINTSRFYRVSVQ